MTLAVQSYLEVYTTLLGWMQYQKLWSVMNATGLIYLPFIGMIFTHFYRPFASQESKEATLVSQRRMEIDFLVAVFVIMVAAQPLIPLNPVAVDASSVCHKSIEEKNILVSLPTVESVKVPLWWYAVLSVSQGITSAAKKGLQCFNNLRDLQLELKLASIDDSMLKKEVHLFVAQCYLPARSRFFSKNNQKDSNKINWIGSKFFLESEGYYDYFRALQPIPEIETVGEWQIPTCLQWWSDPNAGLKKRLLGHLPRSIWDYVLLRSKNSEKVQENAMRTLITPYEKKGFDSLNTGRKLENLSSLVGAGLGIALESISAYPKLYLIKESLPIVQAVFLMSIYIFLALAIPFGRYRMSVLISGSFLLFSVIFWSYLWQIVGYLDEILMEVLYPKDLRFLDVTSHQSVLVDLLIGTMYIGFPLFWSAFMSWVGVLSSRGLDGAVNSFLSPANSAANRFGGHIEKHIP